MNKLQKVWLLIFLCISLYIGFHPPYHVNLPANRTGVNSFMGYGYINALPEGVPTALKGRTSIDYKLLALHIAIISIICGTGYLVTTLFLGKKSNNLTSRYINDKKLNLESALSINKNIANQSVEEITNKFTKKLVSISFTCASLYMENEPHSNLSSDHFLLVSEEYIWLYLQITDRLASDVSDKRDKFMDRILNYLPGIFINEAKTMCSNKTNEKFNNPIWEKEFRNNYNSRMVKYAEYKELVSEKSKPPAGTLLWEFSKIICSITNKINPADNIKIIDICVNGLKQLDINKTIAMIR
ncbi:hypothetical protein [Pectinatus frisingensis]|uniref:hypothetical protein n=1 Tax=Pectinatus frisingensis TaxID=865 RepID=UPI003D8014C3